MGSTRGDRLRAARKKRFESVRLAANALGIPESTFGAHERAQSPRGRDYGPDEAKRYAQLLGVSVEWLLTGHRRTSKDPQITPDLVIGERGKIPIVGYVGAGAETHYYAVAQGEFDEIEPTQKLTDSTVAVEIRGDSLGAFFNRWLVLYDQVRRPATADLFGQLCVAGLPDGRILIKQLLKGGIEGTFKLVSHAEPPIDNVAIDWAAKVTCILPRV
jgi:hypothetical protein